MTSRRHWIPLIPLGLAFAYGATQEQENKVLEERVVALEGRLDEVESYLQSVAKNAESLSAAYDESEKEGFTYGINPSSRHVLLKAWRGQAHVVLQNVPGKKTSTEGLADKR